MDVHPPHEPIHSWRDFLLHLLTITIGLLIALGLEGAVEAMHHRHIVREARENVRQEIEQNEAEAKKNVAAVEKDRDNMKLNLVKARTLRDHPEAMEHEEMHFNFAWSSFNAAAWSSARESGALTYMPTAEVQRYADGYAQQEIVNREAVNIFTHQSTLAAPLMMEEGTTKMSPGDVHTLMYDIAVTELQLDILRQLIEGLESQYKELLHG